MLEGWGIGVIAIVVSATIAVAFALFMMIRSIMLWYFRIDEMIANQETTHKNMIIMHEVLKSIDTSLKKMIPEKGKKS